MYSIFVCDTSFRICCKYLILMAKVRNSCINHIHNGTHQREQIEYMVVVRAHDVEGHAAQLHEVLEALRGPLAAVDHVHHVVRQHERCSVSGQVRK